MNTTNPHVDKKNDIKKYDIIKITNEIESIVQKIPDERFRENCEKTLNAYINIHYWSLYDFNQALKSFKSEILKRAIHQHKFHL